MSITTVDEREAAADLDALIDRVEHGEQFVITRAGRPLARLIAYADGRRRAGSLPGRMQTGSNFDDPLPGELIDPFAG